LHKDNGTKVISVHKIDIKTEIMLGTKNITDIFIGIIVIINS